jgi:hypothetical protein
MSSARFTRTMKEFQSSPEAHAAVPVMPLHDYIPSAPSSSRERQERKERLARPDTVEGVGREGCVPEGGSIASVRSRDIAAASEPTGPDVKAQQRACYEAMQKMGVTQSELQTVGEQVKHLPLARLMDPLTWTSMLEKVRNFGRRRR